MPDTVTALEELAPLADDFAIYSDAARVSWTQQMMCTCLFARSQKQDYICCKHTVHVIRNQRDYVKDGMRHHIPVVLPREDDLKKEIAWVSIKIVEGQLFVEVDKEHRLTLVGAVPEKITRWNVRNLIVPHLLGMVHEVTCDKCIDGQPKAIWNLFHDRTNPAYQLDALREIIHHLNSFTNPPLCRQHDDSDLIPF